jgi:polyhydroxyalkanoate synthase
VRVALGRSEVEPGKGDRRFTDPAWSGNPLFSRIERGYLATAQAVGNVVGELGQSTDNQRRAEQARFATTILTSALAPTNFLATNPAAIKRAFDTGGKSVVRGMRNFVGDLRNNGGMPSMVERDAFEVGKDLALSPGAVVQRDEVGELIQYQPSTEQVYQRPLVIIPPPIGRFYFLDLRPGRSFIEYATSQGIQVFLLSWRNPSAAEGEWDLDTYATRVLAAVDAAREISGSPDVNVMGFCAGGIITTTLLNHLAAIGDDRVHSMSYAVTLLDFGDRAPISAFQGPGLLRFAKARSRPLGHHHQPPDGRRVHLDAAPTTWCSTTGSTTTSWATSPPRSTSWPGTPTARTCPARCTASSSTSSRATCSPSPAACPCSAARCSSTRSRRRRSSPARGGPPHPVAGLLPHHPAARRRVHRSC